MLETIHTFLQSALVQAAITGAIGAAWVDVAAFRKWLNWHEAAEYSWSLATWRWFQGALSGFISAGVVKLGLQIAGS